MNMNLCFTCDKRFGCFTVRRRDTYYFVIRRNLLEYGNTIGPLVCAGGNLNFNMYPSRVMAEHNAESLNQQHGSEFIYTVEPGICAESFGYEITKGKHDGYRKPFTEGYGITDG